MSASRARALSRRVAVVAVAAGIALTGFSSTSHSTASAATETPAATAIHFALNQLGKPYRWGATGPYAYDCSGLTSAAYQAAGITIPRVSRDQYRALPKVPRGSWRPGDLIFYAWNTHDASTIHHVAIFMGDGWMLDAPHDGTVVQIEPVHSGLMYYAARPAGLRSEPLLAVTTDEAGHSVSDLQKRLRANGFSGLSLTGRFDQPTRHAVASLRADYGVSGPSDYVGWKFWHAVVVHGRHRSLTP